MTTRYIQALTLAAQVHDGQVRKGTSIPYITHPVAVAALVANFGGDEDQQIAALLHDVVEDAKTRELALACAKKIASDFGERVHDMVFGCTDGMPDPSGEKAPWADRKRNYLVHLDAASDETLLVSGCDKLSNARAILDDLVTIGPAVFDRFNATKEQTLWYYTELAKIFATRRSPVAAALSATVEEIKQLASGSGASASSSGQAY